MDKAGSKTADDALFNAYLDLSELRSLFECVNHQAQAMIQDGNSNHFNETLC
jgi:hypothetical protein